MPDVSKVDIPIITSIVQYLSSLQRYMTWKYIYNNKVLFRQMPEQCLQLGYDIFLPHPYVFIIQS
jgi:hypothetical protein